METHPLRPNSSTDEGKILEGWLHPDESNAFPQLSPTRPDPKGQSMYSIYKQYILKNPRDVQNAKSRETSLSYGILRVPSVRALIDT
jgi:hypothetical protein